MTLNRPIAAVLFLLAACGGPTKKKPDTVIENDQATESCCCQIETDDPEDPTFTRSAVMECSSRHGTCVKSEIKCEGQPEPGAEESNDSGSLPPTVEDTPNSF